MFTVVNKQQVTTNMLRLTLHGEQLEHVTWQPGCYVKLRVPNGAITKTRTYTVRSLDTQAKTMDIDFAIHRPAGPATSWALNTKIGDSIELRGPGNLRMDSTSGDWYLFVADMSALPAAISIIETLPPNAKGIAFFEVMSEEDKQDFTAPPGIKINWFIHPDPTARSPHQINAIKSISPFEGTPNVFVAGEMSTIKEIKKYLNQEELYKDAFRYVSSYWKIGASEEVHKMVKRLGI
ncbi:MAG: siderophore-interacting protein [Bacteroidota bacterium]